MIDYCIKKASNIPHVANQQRIYSIITDKKGRIISESQNSYVKTHTHQYKCAVKVGKEEKCFLHAEIAAICKLTYKNRDKAYKIYIARVGKNNSQLLAAPCSICQMAISLTSIKEIEYSLRYEGSFLTTVESIKEYSEQHSKENSKME